MNKKDCYDIKLKIWIVKLFIWKIVNVWDSNIWFLGEVILLLISFYLMFRWLMELILVIFCFMCIIFKEEFESVFVLLSSNFCKVEFIFV